VVDDMAQTKKSLEYTIHLDTNVKRFKEMVRAPKEKKIVKGGGLDFKTFQFLKTFVLIRW
jgi:hypothetical protein